MKIWKRAASVGLSLALCAGMVMPSFAAQVLNNTFIGSDGTLLGHDGNGNVATENARYDYELDSNLELEKTLVIKDGVDASIDLKGHDLMLNDTVEATYDEDGYLTNLSVSDKDGLKKGSVVNVKKGGTLTLDDSTAHEEEKKDENGDVILDEDGNAVTEYVSGKVTGGYYGTRDGNDYRGGGIYNEGTLIMNGGSISGNSSNNWGGGVYNIGDMTMNGGQISGNTASHGGGIWNNDKLTMQNGDISGNKSKGDGGGVYNSGAFIMDDGKINHNNGGCDGAGVHMYIGWNSDVWPWDKGYFTMHGGEIADNVGASSGGVAVENGTFTMDGGEIVRNTGNEKTNGVRNAYGTAEFNIDYSKVIICNYGDDGVETVHEFGSWEVTIQPQVGVAGEETRICKHGCGTEETRPIPALTASIPDNNETTIDDVDVPLAGLFTRADAIGYLWQQAGEPEAELSDFPDVDADHQWAVAIGWAQDMGIALPDLEGNFRPDDLVERFVEDEELKPEGELQEFLNRYAEYAGIELDEDELFYVLGGQADDIVMGEDAQIIFDDFFARLEAALAQAA